MAERNRDLTTPGFFQGISNRARLIVRLMGDKRISPLLKLLPIGSLVYLVIPTDLMPIIPVDDAAVLWLGSYMFVELCPQDIVQEHWDQIQKAANILDPKAEQAARPKGPEADVVDAEFTDIGPDKP
jgi:uncharacterized membrane protein YkvA (DUF1232 family)